MIKYYRKEKGQEEDKRYEKNVAQGRKNYTK